MSDHTVHFSPEQSKVLERLQAENAVLRKGLLKIANGYRSWPKNAAQGALSKADGELNE